MKILIGGSYSEQKNFFLNTSVNANLIKAREYINQAVISGAELALFTEFFTSAIGFSPKILDVVKQNRQAQGVLY